MEILVLILLALAICITFGAIIKKFNPAVTLFVAGLILMCISHFMGLGKLPLKDPCGFLLVDLFRIMTASFKSILSGLGLYILSIGGFAYFIDKIGSGETLVYYALKPLKKFKNPYIVLMLVFYFGVLLNMFIDSAAGLGLLLVTTVYPILRGLGLSRLSAASVVGTTGSFAVSPLSSIGALNAELLKMPLADYFFNYKIYTSVSIIIFAGISHYFWQKYRDSKMSPEEKAADTDSYCESTELKHGHPLLAFIPIIPILVMFIPIINKHIKMDITSVMFLSVTISLLIVWFINHLHLKEVFSLCGEYFTGMSKVLSVIVLIVAGDIFAKGLISMGAVTYLVKLGHSLQIGGIGISLIFAACSFLLAAMVGSGNAAIIAFANLSPEVAAHFGVPLMMFLLPLHDIAILGRPIAPVAGVTIAVAGIAKINVMDLAKRNCGPMISTAIFAFIVNMILVPMLVK